MKSNQKDGIHSVNQDYRKYDQVNKEQTYRLAEDQSMEEFDEDFEIQTCDMRLFFEGGAIGKKEFAQQLGAALESIGFAILTGHGVDTNLYKTGQEKTAELFEKTTLEERLVYKAERHGSVNQGYFPMKTTTLIHPDLVEGWVFCRRAFDLDGQQAYNEKDYWPTSGYEDFFRQIIQAHEGLVLPIMQSILSYLQCDPHLYDQKLTNTNFGFRLNYYPPIGQSDADSGAGRMLGHEDVDLFTLLPAQEIEGLQVLNQANGKWIRLNPAPGSIILNTGDYMQPVSYTHLTLPTNREV